MKKIMIKNTLWGLIFAVSGTASASARWYTDDQLAQGKKLFVENCQTCHGEQAQGTKDWKKTDKDGKYPPPPLNGDAHAWHHSMDILRRSVREGSMQMGGSMPPFKDKLNDQQVDAVISYFQSQWNDKTYQGWAARFLKTDKAIASPKLVKIKPVNILADTTAETDEKASSAVTALLQKMVAGTVIGKPEKTPLASFYQVKLGNDYVYVSADGRYLFSGNLIDLKTQKNLTKQQKSKDILATLKKFPERNKIVFKAEGEEKAAINVFTDTSCPYCKKLHSEVPALQKAGVTVKYIAFPRSGLRGEAYQTMKSVWCAKDKMKALGIAKGNLSGSLDKKECDASSAVDAGYELGKQIGISGTPAIVLENGELLVGYVPYKQLLRRIGITVD